MRKHFDGLYGLVRDHLSCDPESGHVFLFTNARRNRLKLLVYDGTDSTVNKIVLSHEELMLLVGGIDLEQTSRRAWYRKIREAESDKLRITA